MTSSTTDTLNPAGASVMTRDTQPPTGRQQTKRETPAEASTPRQGVVAKDNPCKIKVENLGFNYGKYRN